ncbi:MAG: 3-oxoacid CoA-transferase, subunit [Conexibacter sp.]|nr:3-oxoacid CoA-transferase, subunit [Conexibacter sp.]
MSPSDVSVQIARRVVGHLSAGDVVNLGIGIPTLVADLLPPELELHVHTENGMLGVGSSPAPGEADPDLINAGKLPIGQRPGAAYFSSAESFAMIRGGHVGVAVLGALQVDEHGRIANWALPGRPILGVGGAMDLIVGAARVIVTTTHLAKDGTPKVLRECTFPLSGQRAADVVVTDHATFLVQDGGLVLTEIADGSSLGWIEHHTEARFTTALPPLAADRDPARS